MDESAGFLLDYREKLMCCREIIVDDPKGKSPMTSRRIGKIGGATTANRAWEPPPVGWTKINVDGSFSEEAGEGSAVAVARDSNGCVIFTAWRFLEHSGSAPESEALACVEGLRWAVHWGLSRVILETDCAWVVAEGSKTKPRTGLR